MTRVARSRTRSGRTSLPPVTRSMSGARPVHVHVQLAAGERRWRAAEQFPIETHEQLHEAALARGRQDDYAAAPLRWKADIVQVVAIEREQGSTQLPRDPVVLTVR